MTTGSDAHIGFALTGSGLTAKQDVPNRSGTTRSTDDMLAAGDQSLMHHIFAVQLRNQRLLLGSQLVLAEDVSIHEVFQLNGLFLLFALALGASAGRLQFLETTGLVSHLMSRHIHCHLGQTSDLIRFAHHKFREGRSRAGRCRMRIRHIR